MNCIVIDDAQRDRLNGLDVPNEVCDTAGQLLGYLVSPAKYARFRQLEEADLDELDRRAREEETYTLAQIWDELGVR